MSMGVMAAILPLSGHYMMFVAYSVWFGWVGASTVPVVGLCEGVEPRGPRPLSRPSRVVRTPPCPGLTRIVTGRPERWERTPVRVGPGRLSSPRRPSPLGRSMSRSRLHTSRSTWGEHPQGGRRTILYQVRLLRGHLRGPVWGALCGHVRDPAAPAGHGARGDFRKSAGRGCSASFLTTLLRATKWSGCTRADSDTPVR